MKERAIIQLFSFTHLSLSSFLASFCLSDPRLISKALIERSQHQLLRERARETADWLIFSEPRTSSFQKQIAFFFFFLSSSFNHGYVYGRRERLRTAAVNGRVVSPAVNVNPDDCRLLRRELGEAAPKVCEQTAGVPYEIRWRANRSKTPHRTVNP